MSDRELLELIARRLQGEEELIQRCRDAFERCAEASRLNKRTREENIKALDRAVSTMDRQDDKLATSDDFIGDMVRRAEVAGQRSDAWFELMLGRLDALTEAVMRVVDRLDDGPATA